MLRMQARVCNADIRPKRGCTDLSIQTKIRFFQNYNNRTYDEQSALLESLMTLSEVGRRRDGRSDATPLRTCAVKYFIDTSNEVCRLTTIRMHFKLPSVAFEQLKNKMKNNGSAFMGG